MGGRINYGGIIVAGIGFFLTRFTVTFAVGANPVRFYLAGVVPLVLGLGLAAFGIALAVADVDRSLVRSTATWCVIGAGAMLVLVVLTLLGSTAGGVPDLATVRSRTYLSNFLIGGSIGGTLTGLYAARNRRQRSELRQQANRLAVLNRMLRHEVLNAVTAIRGYARVGEDRPDEARAVIETRSTDIEQTIEEVKYLTRTSDRTIGPTDVGQCLRAAERAVRDANPDASVSVSFPDGDVRALANDELDRVFTHLLENAVVHAEGDSTIGVDVTTTANSVRVSVSDDGPGLPARERELLETGDISEFDDPGTGFGLNVVRLLVESFRGSIETSVDDGTTVTVVLPRADGAGTGLEPTPSRLTGVRPALPHMVVTLAASIVAGVSYGVVAEAMGGTVAFIGVYYASEPSAVVGWITHEFHSAVFAFVFAGLVSLAPERYRTHLPAHVAIGVGWGVTLWFFAAGVVSPVWLGLLGFDSSIPTLSVRLFWTHVAWGSTLGVLTSLGYEYVTPALARLEDRYLPTL
jgi:two-component system OmpR family sensor kinase